MACPSLAVPGRTLKAGRLKEGDLLELLRELVGERTTGVLHLSRREKRLSFRLVCGHIVSGSSGESGRLGEILLRCGLLGRNDLERALEQAGREGRRLGPVLVDLGLVARERLEDALRLQVRDVLFTGLSWGEAAWELAADDAPTPLPEDVTLRLSPHQLLLEAAHRIAEPEAVRRALGDVDIPLRTVGDPAVRLDGASLGPADGYVLSRVDGTLTVRQILEISPLPDDEVARSLVALLSAGAIERGPARPRAVPLRGTSHPAPQSEPAWAPQPASRVAAMSADLRREIERAFEGLARKGHFEVLGIPRTSGPEEVKAAYQALARRFHPDALGDLTSPELEDKARAVFVRATEAYRVLRAAGSRARYEELVSRPARAASPGTPAASPSPAPAPSAGPAAAAPSPLPDAQRWASIRVPGSVPAALEPVGDVLRTAEEHLAAGRLWEASLSLEDVLARSKGPLRERAHLLLARTCAKSPSGAKRAEAELKALIEEDPRCVAGFLALGQLYKDKGLTGRAAYMFRKVLSLEPGHARADQELRTMPAPLAPAGGIFGRLMAR